MRKFENAKISGKASAYAVHHFVASDKRLKKKSGKIFIKIGSTYFFKLAVKQTVPL